MKTAQHSTTRCPVFIHPAAASNPATIERIQQATRQLVVIRGGRPTLTRTAPEFDGFDPFGGFAA